MKPNHEMPVVAGSGNVFADLGFSEPEEELLKAQLATHIRRILKSRRLTQSAAAALASVDQPKISAIVNGRLANFSSERLMRILTALGHDLEIRIKQKTAARERGTITVVGESLGK